MSAAWETAHPDGRAEAPRQRTEAVLLPPYFFEDWLDCFCHLDVVKWRRRGRQVEASMSARDLADLLSRARHYQDHPDYELGMRASARATVAAIQKQTKGAA